jgi:hypothetical protein
MPLEIGRTGLPVLDQFSEEGFVDCVFFVGHSGVRGERLLFELRAECDGDIVGLDVDMVAAPGPGFDAEMQVFAHHVYADGFTVHPAGPASDRFMAALARRFGLAGGAPRTMGTASFTAMVLQQQVVSPERGAERLKLECGTGDDHYEGQFTLDIPHGRAFWKEKDTDQRRALLRALGGG